MNTTSNEADDSKKAKGFAVAESVSLSRWLGCADAKSADLKKQYSYTKATLDEFIDSRRAWKDFEIRIDLTAARFADDGKTFIIPMSFVDHGGLDYTKLHFKKSPFRR